MKVHSFILSTLLLIVTSFGCDRVPESAIFYKGNLHTHSYWSDGNGFPGEVTAWYKDQGYHFLAVTDHNILQEGEKIVNVRGEEGIVLQELESYRSDFEEPGKFLLIHGEEISDAAERKPVHLNGINLKKMVPPAKGATVEECVINNVKAIREALKESGTPEWVIINHPNFGWALKWTDLAKSGARFFEVFNGHPGVRNYGDSIRPSTEEMWDQANKWRIDNDEPLLLGVATDDAHHYDTYKVGRANPGRGWVMVRTGDLAVNTLYEAMVNANYYCSTGVELVNFKADHKRIQLWVNPEEGVEYTTEFVGWLEGSDEPEVLKRVDGTEAAYRLTGKELFVRARVISSKIKDNPFAEGDQEMAWLQPVTP